MLRAGDPDLCPDCVYGEAEDATGALFEVWRGTEGTGGGLSNPAELAVGVACGVEAAELAFATEIGVGVCLVTDGV